MAYLLVTTGQSAGTSFDVTKCPFRIGRDCTQDAQLPDESVSRKHLVIDRAADGSFIVKAQPKANNGMLVNGDAVPKAVLDNGDRIRIGETEFLFLATDRVSELEAVKRVRVWC